MKTSNISQITFLGIRAWAPSLLASLLFGSALAVNAPANAQRTDEKLQVLSRRCEMAAGHPDDDAKSKDIPGVAFDKINVRDAIALCSAAVDALPYEPVLHYNYGRALAAGKELASAHRQYAIAEAYQHKRAAFDIAQDYYFGDGVEIDYDRAAKFSRRALTLNVLDAYFFLGNLYTQGQGVKKDMVEAARLFRTCAELDQPDCMGALGRAYAAGEGVPSNSKEAMRWYLAGADRGDSFSMGQLSAIYGNGDLSEKNDAKSYKWAVAGSKLGDSIAMNTLGVLYNKGIVVDKDLDAASYWFRKAAAAGNEIAKENLEGLARERDNRTARSQGYDDDRAERERRGMEAQMWETWRQQHP